MLKAYVEQPRLHWSIKKPFLGTKTSKVLLQLSFEVTTKKTVPKPAYPQGTQHIFRFCVPPPPPYFIPFSMLVIKQCFSLVVTSKLSWGKNLESFILGVTCQIYQYRTNNDASGLYRMCYPSCAIMTTYKHVLIILSIS